MTTTVSTTRKWISYIVQGIVVIMFLMGSVMNILQTEQAVAGATALGYPEATVLLLGVTLLISTLLYVFPKTSGFGAVLLTGWLGGAVASHVIHQDPLFNILFPVIFGLVIWLALWLRQDKVQRLFSL